jgi:hypothetical protein
MLRHAMLLYVNKVIEYFVYVLAEWIPLSECSTVGEGQSIPTSQAAFQGFVSTDGNG